MKLKHMLNDKEAEEYNQDEQKPVEILKTDKADNSRNPLLGDLSGKPEEENKAVRDQDADARD